MRKYGSNDPLTVDQTASLATASANVIRSIVGRTRYLYELVSGESGDDDDPPVTPRNPSGGIGVNLSGPPWGAAVRHTVWMTGGIVDSTTTAVTPPPIVRLVESSDAQINTFYLVADVYMRNFDQWAMSSDRAAPYSRLQFTVGAVADSSVTMYIDYSISGSFTQVKSLSLTTTPTYFDSGDLIPARPGKNRFTFRFTRSDNSVPVNVYHLGLHNIKKIQHVL